MRTKFVAALSGRPVLFIARAFLCPFRLDQAERIFFMKFHKTPRSKRSTYTYVAIKEQCEKRGIKVYNATRGGKLEVFQRVDFDDLF